MTALETHDLDDLEGIESHQGMGCAPFIERHEHPNDDACYMKEWEGAARTHLGAGQSFALCVGCEPFGGKHGIAHQPAMREQCPLGEARRAGGGDKCGRGGWTDRTLLLGECLVTHGCTSRNHLIQ